jgi:hypothetical protein
MVNRQTCAISHTNMVRTPVCIRGQVEVVQIIREVVSSPYIRVPAIIGR